MVWSFHNATLGMLGIRNVTQDCQQLRCKFPYIHCLPLIAQSSFEAKKVKAKGYKMLWAIGILSSKSREGLFELHPY